MNSKTKSVAIPVGFQWRSGSGKEWVVTRVCPGGVCEIHQVGRFVSGQMYARCIRYALENGTATKIETTPDAYAILRRCNG